MGRKKFGTCQNAVIGKLPMYRLFRQFFIFLHFLQSIIFVFSTKCYFATSTKSTLLFLTLKCYFALPAKSYFASAAKSYFTKSAKN
jgi:hypothetical protein